MGLWIEWWNLVRQLRPAFTRRRTFIWFAVVLAAMCVRTDLLGVTSMVRALGLQKHCYDRLLDFFHSRAINLDKLTRLWTHVVLTVFQSFVYVVGDRIVLVADEGSFTSAPSVPASCLPNSSWPLPCATACRNFSRIRPTSIS
jgi:hypothetical protein